MGEVQSNFFYPNLKPMHNLFLMGKTNKGLEENKALGRVSREALHQTHIYIYLEPKVVVFLLHGIVITTYFIQWKHHWRYFNLKDGSFPCKRHKVPNILHAIMCFQQIKNKKTLKCFMWRSYIKILWTNFLCVFVSALHNTVYPLTLAFASILQIYKCVKGGRFKLSPFF